MPRCTRGTALSDISRLGMSAQMDGRMQETVQLDGASCHLPMISLEDLENMDLGILPDWDTREFLLETAATSEAECHEPISQENNTTNISYALNKDEHEDNNRSPNPQTCTFCDATSSIALSPPISYAATAGCGSGPHLHAEIASLPIHGGEMYSGRPIHYKVG